MIHYRDDDGGNYAPLNGKGGGGARLLTDAPAPTGGTVRTPSGWAYTPYSGDFRAQAGGYAYPIATMPTGQFLLDVLSRRVYRASDGAWLENPEAAFAAGVARDWSNLTPILGPPQKGATSPPPPTPGGEDEEEDGQGETVADLFNRFFGPYMSGGGEQSEPRTVTTYSPAEGPGGGGGGLLVVAVLVIVAFGGYYLYKKNKKGGASADG